MGEAEWIVRAHREDDVPRLDAAQEAFVRSYTGIRDFDPRPRLMAFLDWLGSVPSALRGAPAALRGMRPRWRRSRA